MFQGRDNWGAFSRKNHPDEFQEPKRQGVELKQCARTVAEVILRSHGLSLDFALNALGSQVVS